MKTKSFAIILSVGILLAGLGIVSHLDLAPRIVPAWNPASILSSEEPDHLVGKAVNIMDEKGNVISQVCRGVAVGDEIINYEGKHYRVINVDRDKAVAKSLGYDKDLLAWIGYFNDENLALAAATAKKGTVGVYHTHTDEAYVPSDGSANIPFKGGIYGVGQSFVNKLRQKTGSNVLYDKTPHDPHDNSAYQRSRPTAMRLLKQNPIAIFDVHRDGIPDAGYYRATIANEDVSKLRLVVGRQNPNMQANLDFAKRMMAYANKVHPGIVKEIFMARGNYNQDLSPTALLIEAGTHTNTKGEAERGIALFADAVPTVLGIQGGPATGPTGRSALTDRAAGRSGWRAVGWILGLTLVLGGGFLLISTGSLKGVGDRLSSIGKEFTNYLGPVKKRTGAAKKPRDSKITQQAYHDQADRAVIDHRDDVTED